MKIEQPGAGPSPRARTAWVARLDHALGLLVEIPTALLVLLEILVLLAGVISRYVFHHPIIWSDELVSSLFLWLAVPGSGVGRGRPEHMRMTAFVGLLSAPTRALLDVVAIVAALTFFL